MNTAENQSERKGIALPPDMGSAIQRWGNSFFRAAIPTNLMAKSVVTEIKDERAKLLTAEFLYGERNGTFTGACKLLSVNSSQSNPWSGAERSEAKRNGLD
jgi:hypothetical protein